VDEKLRHDVVSDADTQESSAGNTNEQSGMDTGEERLTVSDLIQRIALLGVSDNELLFGNIREKLDPALEAYIKQWTDIRVQLTKDAVSEDILRNLAATIFAIGFVAGAAGYKPELLQDGNAVVAIGAAVLTVARETFSAELTSAGTDVPAGT